MATSSVPAVKAALVDTILPARPGLSGVEVAWYTHKALSREAVFLGEVEPVQRAAAIGGRSRNEEYDLEVVCHVRHPGPVARDAEERAWALVAEVEDACGDDPHLGLPGLVVRAQVARVEMNLYAGPREQVAEGTVYLKVEARL